VLHISFGNRALRGELSSRVRVRPRGSAYAERPETTRRKGIDELNRPRRNEVAQRRAVPQKRQVPYRRMSPIDFVAPAE